MSLVCVFAASKSEGEPVQRITGAAIGGGVPFGASANQFILITDGMGPKAARAKAIGALRVGGEAGGSSQADDRKPDAVLVIGFCGALTADLPEIRIVAYRECLSTESGRPSLSCSPFITGRVQQLLTSHGIACDSVTGITSPRVAVTVQNKMALARSGASVVDMESYEILDVAAQAGIPAAVLRVVSDSLDRDMPDFNRALREDGTVNRWQLLTTMLGSPLQTARLVGINKRAMHHFAKALEIVLPSDCFTPSHSPAEK